MADEGLNDGQRECLKLVLAHYNSKEIGRKLGISPHTVDQRLRRAIRILGAESRFEAARKFAEMNRSDSYQPLIYQSSDIAVSKENEMFDLSARSGDRKVEELYEGVSDSESEVAVVPVDRLDSETSRFPFPRFRGQKNELSAVERLGWILVIAIGSALCFGGLISGLEALSRLSGR